MPVHIPNHKLIKMLDEGAMGEVWLGEHIFQRRLAAIKILKASAHDSDDSERLFIRECELLATFDHPNIVKIYDSGRVDGYAYLVMEYLAGGTLLRRMAEGGIPVGESIALIVQLAGALDVVHRHKLVHRDLKPANIMLRDRCVPVLLDFGVARQIDRSTIFGARGMVVGTAAYMSPEQISGLVLDGRSDLYALGVLFHELLTGRHPFPGNSVSEICTQHLCAALPVLPRPLAALQGVLDQLLAKNAEDRHHDARAFIDRLRQVFLDDESLRRQIGYAGTGMAWSSQLRALGFDLGADETDGVRRAQGAFLGAAQEHAAQALRHDESCEAPVDEPTLEHAAQLRAKLMALDSDSGESPVGQRYRVALQRLLELASAATELDALAAEAEAARKNLAGRVNLTDVFVAIRSRIDASEALRLHAAARDAADRGNLLPPAHDNALDLLRRAHVLSPNHPQLAVFAGELPARIAHECRQLVTAGRNERALALSRQAVIAFPHDALLRQVLAEREAEATKPLAAPDPQPEKSVHSEFPADRRGTWGRNWKFLLPAVLVIAVMLQVLLAVGYRQDIWSLLGAGRRVTDEGGVMRPLDLLDIHIFVDQSAGGPARDSQPTWLSARSEFAKSLLAFRELIGAQPVIDQQLDAADAAELALERGDAAGAVLLYQRATSSVHLAAVRRLDQLDVYYRGIADRALKTNRLQDAQAAVAEAKALQVLRRRWLQ